MNDATIKDMLFSCLSGHNIYVPSKYDRSSMLHLLSNTDVTVKAVKGIEPILVENKWRYFIERPVDIKNITWPVDIVNLPEKQMGLVFRKRAFPKMEPLKKILYNSNLLDWNRPEIRKLIGNLLKVFEEIHTGGYAYHAFDMEHMYYNEESFEVLIEFSLGMSIHCNDVTHISNVGIDSVAIEFVPPWVELDSRNCLSLSDDYYSIAAMLFRLMIGRMPYQGRLMDGHGDMMDLLRDIDPDTHVQMFKHYHDNPIFIFDPEDDINNVGVVTSVEKFKDRWEDLPEEIKAMFIKTFSKETLAMPYKDRKLYSVREWIDALTQAGILS